MIQSGVEEANSRRVHRYVAHNGMRIAIARSETNQRRSPERDLIQSPTSGEIAQAPVASAAQRSPMASHSGP